MKPRQQRDKVQLVRLFAAVSSWLLITPALADDPETTATTQEPTPMVIDMTGMTGLQASTAPTPESQVVLDYQRQIERLELESGAYAATLPEQLMGLGNTLQSLNRHEEAIEVFKRGVHLARINEGLYGREQIALVRGEIRSHMAIGDWDAVDERQRYLYRVEREALVSSAESAEALMQQADWQRQAFMLGVGDDEQMFSRLQLMWKLYRMAFSTASDAYGNESLQLRKPLVGMLQTQYLFAGYRNYDQFEVDDSNELRILGLNSRTYRQGESILKGILELNIANNVSVSQHVRDVVGLGDWAWWFDKEDEAMVHYHQAIELMAEAADPEGLEQEIFSLPMLLPHLEGVAALPPPLWNDTGALSVSFTVTENGTVDDMERLGDPEVELDSRASRLLRALKQAQFRPRFEDGTPVRTEGMVWSWQPSDWQQPILTLNQR